MKNNESEIVEEKRDKDEGKTFGEYWRMICKHWISVVVCVVLALVVGLGYDIGIKSPEYQASGSCMVLSIDDESGEGVVTYTDVNYSLILLQSVNDIMIDTPVMTAVTESMNSEGYNYTVEQVSKMVTASPRTFTSSAKSLFIDITATSSDIDTSVKLVNFCLDDSLKLINTDGGDYAFLKDALKITSRASKTGVEDVATSTTLICAVSLVIGLIIGIIYAIVKELTNVFVISKKELELASGLKILGTIPDYSEAHKKHKNGLKKHARFDENVGLIEDMGSIASEKIQILQTNISFAAIDKEIKVISVTSAVQSEGKSTTLGNLAKLYAEKGLKVCVIDLDIRRSSIHKLFGIKNQAGIVEYVRGEADLKHVIQNVGGVDIITSGSKTPFPTKIIQSPKLKTLIEDLRAQYDYILIDTTPVIVVADALLLSQLVDGFLLVCAQHSTRKREFDEAVEILNRANAPVIGGVMTMVTEDDSLRKGHYGYGYGYGYYSREEDGKDSKNKCCHRSRKEKEENL